MAEPSLVQSDPSPEILGFGAQAWGQPLRTVRELLNNQSFVSLKHRYCFMATPKVACTSLKSLLLHLEGLEPVYRPTLETKPNMVVHLRQAYNFASLLTIPENLAREVLQSSDYFRFAVVRNPYGRLVSAWKNKIYLEEPVFRPHIRKIRKLFNLDTRPIPFEAFLDYVTSGDDRDSTGWTHWHPQVSLLFSRQLNYTHLGRLETIEATLDAFENHLSPMLSTPLKLGLENASPSRGDWRELYNANRAAQAYQFLKVDFERFGYDPDSWRAPVPSQTPNMAALVEVLESEIIARNQMIELLFQALKS